MKFNIDKEELVFNDFFKITKAEITHDSFQPEKNIQATRLSLNKGNAVGVLIYEKDSDSFLLTKQFRYPTSQNGHPWMTEIPAGMVDEGEAPETTARRETLEELGYNIKELTPIGTYYSSPGTQSEYVYMYYAEVTSEDKVEHGGGLDNESEDIQLIKISAQELKRFLPKINDFKTMVAFQWYMLHKAL